MGHTYHNIHESNKATCREQQSSIARLALSPMSVRGPLVRGKPRRKSRMLTTSISIHMSQNVWLLATDTLHKPVLSWQTFPQHLAMIKMQPLRGPQRDQAQPQARLSHTLLRKPDNESIPFTETQGVKRVPRFTVMVR